MDQVLGVASDLSLGAFVNLYYVTWSGCKDRGLDTHWWHTPDVDAALATGDATQTRYRQPPLNRVPRAEARRLAHGPNI